ncbi:phage major capsid protein [Xanthobacter flavus]|uniref:phage major capsid protein n=1 Tax=Xanthobacter flavus TaxID=281 RepID=UPI00372AC2EB
MFHTPNRVLRGLVAARADTNANAILAELQSTFAAFKAAHEEELAGIKKNFADVISAEKVAKINAEITTLTAALDTVNAQLAASKVGGGGQPDPARREHRAAFHRFFREGADAGLGDLQVKAGLTSQSKPDGGYLVPTEMESTIDRVLGTVSVMRGLATVRQIGTSTYTRLVNMAGAGYGWVGEEETRTETATPTLRELEFTVMELYAEPYATQVMLDDAQIDIEAWLADEVQTTFAEKEGEAFITGNGVKRPRGLLSYNTVANASYAWGSIGFVTTGAAAAFAASNPADAMVDLYYALRQGYRANASWLMSDAVMASVRKFKDGQGNYLWQPPSAAGEVATILQKPVYTDDNMPALGANAFPVAFGDFRRAYLVLDRVGIRVLRNPYKVNGKVAFYTTKRVGGGLQNFEAVKLLKCST